MNNQLVSKFLNVKKFFLLAGMGLIIFSTACKKLNVNEVSGPSVTAISPGRGTVGTTVSFTGVHFGKSISENRVSFDGVVAPISSASGTQLIVTAPAHDPGIVSITIMVNGKESKAVEFDYE